MLPKGNGARLLPYEFYLLILNVLEEKGILTWCWSSVFPEPEIDPVIQIANILTVQGIIQRWGLLLGDTKPIHQNVFTLNTCGAIVGAEINSFEKEVLSMDLLLSL